ncbi:hypothetical protein [Neisseria sicca]|nr:hypothetical protein [Neisseria sicca]
MVFHLSPAFVNAFAFIVNLSFQTTSRLANHPPIPHHCPARPKRVILPN